MMLPTQLAFAAALIILGIARMTREILVLGDAWCGGVLSLISASGPSMVLHCWGCYVAALGVLFGAFSLLVRSQGTELFKRGT